MNEGIPGEFPLVAELLGGPDGRTLLAALQALLEARQRERGANSPEARDLAQHAALDAAADIDDVLGITALRRRRMLADEPGGEPDQSAGDFRRIARDLLLDDTPGARSRLRSLLGRFIYDHSETLGNQLASLLVAHLMQVGAGREGIMTLDGRQGVDPTTGAAFVLHKTIVATCGYTVGRTITDEQVPARIWIRAAKACNAMASKLRARGEKVKAITTPSTIRGWCSRAGDLADLFAKNRDDGRRDRADGCVDRDRLLD